MKQKLIISLAISFLVSMIFSGKALAAEGDAWITPTNQDVETSQHFDIQVHADTGGKMIGAFNMYFDFNAAHVTVDTSLGSNGMTKGADATAYLVNSNAEDIANGHYRFAGIAAQDGANGADVHLVTIHCVSTAGFTADTSAMTLRVNELANELGVALATGSVTGAIITYKTGDTTAPVLSAGAPTGTLNAGTTSANLTLTTNENATCKYGIIPNTAYASIANTFSTTSGVSQSSGLTGLTNGASYNYYVRCVDGAGNANLNDYIINFSVDSPPTNITLSNSSINENAAVNTIVGTLSATDPESGDTQTFSLTCATPGANDASFNISGTNLRSSAVFDYETKSSYAICVRTNDGHSGTYDKNFTIAVNNIEDVTPTITAFVIPTTSTSLTVPINTFTATDDIGVTGYCLSETNSSAGCSWNGTAQTEYIFSTEGAKTLYAFVKDAASNTSVSSNDAVTITLLDTTAPTIVSISSNKVDGTYKVGEVIDIHVNFSENVTSAGNVIVTLETGATDRTCTFTVANANTGTCNYTVQSGDTASDLTVNSVAGTINDAASNTMINFVPGTNLAASKALIIDTTNPTITINDGTSLAATGDDTINLTANDANLNITSLEYGFSADDICDGSDTYGHSFINSANFHILTTHTDYLCAKAADNAGNIGYQLIGQLNVGDITAPILSAGTPAGTLNAGTINANLTLITDEDSTCKYDTIPNTDYDSMANIFTITGGTAQSQSLTGLTNGTSYHYYVRCVDGAGNANLSDYAIGFSIDNSPTDIAISATAINENVAINTVVGALTTTDPDGGDTFTYSLACATPGADDTSFNISSANLRSSAVFDYEIKSSYAICVRTNDGHNGTFDKNFTITVNDLDDTAPVITAFVIPTTSTSLTVPITTFTATDDTAVTGYCLSESNSSAGCSWSGTAQNQFVFSTSGAKTLYAFAKDAVNNISVSSSDDVMITLPDTTAPVLSAGAPSGALTAGTTGTNLTLTTSENATCKYGTTPGVAYASITNTFTTTGGTSQSKTLTGLTNGTSYNYYVRCIDGAGNANLSDYTISFSVSNVVLVTCTSFTYSTWGTCQTDNTQTRTVISQSPSGCTGGTPVLSQSCTYAQICTSFTYSDWDDCQSDNTQTRTVISQSPTACTGGTPTLSQTCTYVADGDGNTVEVDPIDNSDIASPYLKITKYLKEKLSGGKKFYAKNKNFYFKGDDSLLAGGTVKLYEGSDKEDEDRIGSDGEWSLKTDKKDNDTYTYRVKYYDSNGDEIDSKKYKVEVDSADPVFKQPFPTAFTKRSADKIYFDATDDNLDYYKVKLLDDQGHIRKSWRQQQEAYYFVPSDVAYGKYTFIVRAYDKAGNYAEETVLLNFVQHQTSSTPVVTAPAIVRGETTERTQVEDTLRSAGSRLEQPAIDGENSPAVLDNPVVQNQKTLETEKSFKWWNPFSWF